MTSAQITHIHPEKQMPNSGLPTDAAVALLGNKIDGLLLSDKETKVLLREMSNSINKLAVIEERQTTQSDSIRRAFQAIDKQELDNKATLAAFELRLKAMESQAPLTALTNTAVGKVVMATILILVGGMVASLINKAPPQQPAVMIQQAPPQIQQAPQQRPQSSATPDPAKPSSLKYRI